MIHVSAAVEVDRPQVFALDVEERCLARAQHPVDDAAHQRPRVPPPLRIRMRADGANLAKVADPCPLARHRDENAALHGGAYHVGEPGGCGR